MSTREQRVIWDKNWQHQTRIEPQTILNASFTLEAYHCLKNFIDYRTDKLILEAGCGTGRFCCLLAKDFSDSSVIGIDTSSNALMCANHLKKCLHVPNVAFKKGDLFRMPYPDNYFDVVFNEEVIEHFSLDESHTYKDAIHEMIRVTKKGGKVIIAVPNLYCFSHTFYKWLLQRLGKNYECGYEKSFKHKELISLFEEFGLCELELSAFYPTYGLYRLCRYSRVFSLAGK